MELSRDIYKELLKWKEENNGHVLELRGARQVGKTYILDKFARENYSTYLYVNMVQTSGREFLKCLERATAWEPGTPRKEHPLHEAMEEKAVWVKTSSLKEQRGHRVELCPHK